MKPSPTQTAALLTGLLFGALVAGHAHARGDAAAPLRLEDDQGSVPPMTGEIIDTIEQFEAQRDAKCYATASRLENFIFGTPLSDDARFLKIDLQKAVIASVWRRASAAAVARGSDEVLEADVRPLLSALISFREDDRGNLGVELADRTLLLLARDVEHYSSIAYALRAILAVQQEQLWGGGSERSERPERLLPLSSEAVETIRQTLDVLTLTVLALADAEARDNNEHELSGARFESVWARVVPPEAATRPAGRSSSSPQLPDASTFRAIVDQKIKSYAAYNEIDQKQAKLFRTNVHRHYARYDLPPSSLTLPESLGRAAEGFLSELIRLAEASARLRNEAFMRVRDVSEALQIVTPHRVDDLEDVTFFPRLAASERVVLAAFDLDSFRDFGMHWKLIQIMLDTQRVVLSRAPDPFAAELLAEGMAQYSVLVLRIAGRIAAARGARPFMTGEHVALAAQEIRKLASSHAEAAVERKQAAPIRSAGGARRISSDALMSDVTHESGIDFQHRSSDWLNRFRHDITQLPPTFSGGGLAAGDVNGDGLSDLLFVGGIGNALYVNNGSGGFDESPLSESLQFSGHDGLPAEARQPLIADFDNDGRQDILITHANASHRLLRQLEDGRLEDVSLRAALGGEGVIAGPATVFDYDRDGLLDIYICRFGNYIRGHFAARGAGDPDAENAEHGEKGFPGALPMLARNNVNAGPNRLLRNLGGMRFEEVAASGAEDRGWCQAVAHTDLDGDGYQDIVVANDFGRNGLFRNTGEGGFEDVSESLGMVRAYHSMNVGIADLNADALPDLYISNINTLVKDNRYVLPSASTEMKMSPEAMAGIHIVEASLLYLSVKEDGALERYEESDAVERSTAVGWAWDAEFFDFDNDGDDDLYVLNGTNEYFDFHTWNMESNVFYVNEGGVLRNLSKQSGADFPGNSRSAVYLDYDRDGDLDIAVNNFERSASFFRNNLDGSGDDTHWIRVKLEGKPELGSNRDAIGAQITATTADGTRIWREVHGGSGYLSMEPKVQHFGLGGSARVDLRIVWPGGGAQQAKGLDSNRTWLIREGEKPSSLRWN